MRLPLRPGLLGLLAAAVLVPAAPTTALAAKAKSTTKIEGKALTSALGVKSGRTTVKVRATGGRTLTSVTASVSAPKGVIARFRSGKKTTSNVRISKLRSSKPTTLTLSLRRTGDGPIAGAVTVKLKRKGKTIGSGAVNFGPGATDVGPPPNPNTLAGRTFWSSLYSLSGTSQDSLLFLSDTMAFAGDASGKAYADGAAPPACPAVTEDCVPYSYDAKSGALTVGGKPATVKPDGGIEWDGRFYGEYAAPPAGTRWDTVVTYANAFGLCPLSCTYVREDLRFLPDGQFVRDSVVSGSSPTVDFASIPASRKGTYEVRADKTLLLAFADGTQRVRTIALAKNADGSLQTPADGGMVIGGEGYFDIRKD